MLTPPTSAYWAFWYANPGQRSWTYSQTGAMSERPGPGSVELWVFGGTSSDGSSGSAVPTVTPASLRAHLGWLHDAGFSEIDCIWKDLEQGLLWARKPEGG